MAERYAVKSGSLSDATLLDGGTPLSVGDDLYANGFTVTIDQDITVNSLRTTAGATAVAGGEFADDAAGGHTITADCFAGTTTCVSLNADNPCSLYGDLYGGTASPSYGGIISNGATVFGNTLGGSSPNSHGVRALNGAIINGNATGGLSAPGATLSSGAILNGNAVASATENGVDMDTGSVLNGTATGGSGSNNYGAKVRLGAIFNGFAIGNPSSSSGYGVYAQDGAVLIVRGLTAGSGAAVNLREPGITLIMLNDVTIDQFDIHPAAANYTLGNENLPFINEAGPSYAALHRIAALNGLRIRTTA